jgi:hypothetical protein
MADRIVTVAYMLTLCFRARTTLRAVLRSCGLPLAFRQTLFVSDPPGRVRGEDRDVTSAGLDIIPKSAVILTLCEAETLRVDNHWGR